LLPRLSGKRAAWYHDVEKAAQDVGDQTAVDHPGMGKAYGWAERVVVLMDQKEAKAAC
jgi:hypothetical protein